MGARRVVDGRCRWIVFGDSGGVFLRFNSCKTVSGCCRYAAWAIGCRWRHAHCRNWHSDALRRRVRVVAGVSGTVQSVRRASRIHTTERWQTAHGGGLRSCHLDGDVTGHHAALVASTNCDHVQMVDSVRWSRAVRGAAHHFDDCSRRIENKSASHTRGAFVLRMCKVRFRSSLQTARCDPLRETPMPE